METQALSEATTTKPKDTRSCLRLLKVNREGLVTHIRNVQCLIDNLLVNEYFSLEDAEIVGACSTLPDKVRKMLDLVQSKGEEVCEYLIHVLQKIPEAFLDLQPWLEDICFSPSELVKGKRVVNTDPVSRYRQQLRLEWAREAKFVRAYGQQEERLLAATYTEPLMELVDFGQESLGPVRGLDALLAAPEGVLNPEAEAVLVLGDAGMGKTVLLQQLQSLWARGELAGPGPGPAEAAPGAPAPAPPPFLFLFPFRCRSLGRLGPAALSLRELLFGHACRPELEPDAVFAHLLRRPQSVLLTFDGLDELPADWDLAGAPAAASPARAAPAPELLAALLRGRLLPRAAKVLTARSAARLPRGLVRKQVRLRGFSAGQLRAHARRCFPERAARLRVLAQLEASPALAALCSVPLVCGIVFGCFGPPRRAAADELGPPPLPPPAPTLTDVFLLLAEAHLRRALPPARPGPGEPWRAGPGEPWPAGRGALAALGRLAYWGLRRGLLVFSAEELRAARLGEAALRLGFVRRLPGPGPPAPEPVFEFSHAALQAFLAALFLVADAAVGTRELRAFLGAWAPRGRGRRGPGCLRGAEPEPAEPPGGGEPLQLAGLFVCGLLAKAQRRRLRALAPARALRRKRRALWAHLAACLRAHLRGLPRTRVGAVRQVQAMPAFLWMLRGIYETQSGRVGRRAAGGVRADYLKLSYCDACPADCSALAFVLRHAPRRLGLDLDNNRLNDYGVAELRPCLGRLTVLRLSVNQITDYGVKVLYEELTKYKILTFLGLYNNQITNVGAKYVAKILEECTSLTHLKLGANNITSEGGKYLALALKKSKSIMDIGMWGNKIGDEGAKAFADALRNHPSLANLSLAFNDISTEGGKSLAQALQQNNSVKIVWLTKNNLNDEVAESLAEMLEVNQSLSDLWLIQNQITAKGVSRLADALQKNTTILDICLNGNPIKPEEIKIFQDEKRFHF
ncbi:nucleotide-binding oligomerization domain-containing protein 1 [Macrotis lagotis]|uniref:nucleotide-binding oligomerization domain-containing protein 1 n=1 Tax=Macrotis lagotis TaxID=92651 RepID=UPI003D69AB8C